MTARNLSIGITLAALISCSHGPKPKVAAASKPSEPAAHRDASLLGDTDVRLVTEALAYDVTHGPWLQAYQTAHDTEPTVFVGSVPDTVAPSDVPFPQASFTDSLVQSLRNTHRLQVVPSAQGAAPPVWRLDVAAFHDGALVEGEQTRGYRIEATLRLCPSLTPAWTKSYALRKRVRPEPADVPASK